MRAAAKWSALLLATMIGSGFVASRKHSTGSRLAALIQTVDSSTFGGQPSPREVWYVFRPSDCALGTARFDTLMAVGASPGTRVIGVMIEAPRDSSAARRLKSIFGIRVPLLYDQDGRWSKAVEADGHRLPLFVVRRQGTVSAVLQPMLEPMTATILTDLAGGAGRLETVVRAQRMTAPDARRFRTGQPRLERRIDFASGADLTRPELLAADSERIYTYDFGDRLLKAFDYAGHAKWVYGRAGTREQRFANPFDMKVGHGGVDVFDVVTRTLSSFTANGTLEREVILKGDIQRFARGAASFVFGFDPPRDGSGGFVFDSTGKVLLELPALAQVRGRSLLVRESLVASLPGSDSVAIAYRHGGYLAVIDPRRGSGAFRQGIEPIPFPETLALPDGDGNTVVRVAPNAPTGALAIDADEHRIYVLFAGRTENAGRVIDIYDRATGNYQESLLLSTRATTMARVPTGFVTTVSSLTGAHASVDIWRWSGAR